MPVGVIGAVFEARPNVTVDVASQVLKARSAAVLRTGSAALGSARALVDLVLAPALEKHGVPAAAVQLVPTPGHAGAEALVGLPDLVPLVVVRGSGEVTRKLSALGAAAGTRVLAHADGGGVLYLDASAAAADVTRLVTEGTDRLGVCNRLNLLLIDRPAYDRLWPLAEQRARARGIAPSLPPHAHPLGHEWALDSGAEAHVTVAAVDGPVDAAQTAARETSGLAATVCATDEAAATAFVDAYTGTGVFWNATTRLLDGYKLLGLPETGINVDHTPGPRGPVTYLDLSLRQFVVLPPPDTASDRWRTAFRSNARVCEAGHMATTVGTQPTWYLFRNSGEARPRASMRTNVVTTVLAVWFTLGLFLDAYAHSTFPQLETLLHAMARGVLQRVRGHRRVGALDGVGPRPAGPPRHRRRAGRLRDDDRRAAGVRGVRWRRPRVARGDRHRDHHRHLLQPQPPRPDRFDDRHPDQPAARRLG